MSGEEVKKTILIVEDEDDIRQVYAEVLESSGYRVVQAANGQEGLDKAQSEDWDVMLLDIIIPEVDGVTVLKKIKEFDSFLNRPVIMLTNLDSEHLIESGFEHGASGYLIKSEITPDKIVKEIEVFLEK